LVCKKSVLAWIFPTWLLAVTSVWAQPLPESGNNVHEGVATCASSVCHGKVSPDPTSTVWLNEYRVWLRQDFHSRAYNTLLTKQSQAIATKLGLASAQGAKICLDCHADNVATEARGRRFQVSDGVGCEACHGGSGKWLESHAEEGTSHADNVLAGMYPTEQPLARAKLCLSCHLGTRDKFATHAIMGAGHPRLSFELETFTVNQPAHYEVDADYGDRKPATPSINMWLAGLVVSSMQTLELLQTDWFSKGTLVPELSFYQCHACHHPMNDLRWEPEGSGQALPPGSVRLNDGNLRILAAVLAFLDPTTGDTLLSRINELHRESMADRQAVMAQAKVIQGQLTPLVKQLSNETYSASQLRGLRQNLLMRAGEGDFRHFTSAEQVFLAVETLSLALGDQDKYSDQLNGLFSSVEDENVFVPKQFAVLANKMRNTL
jgi:hypothetical protein